MKRNILYFLGITLLMIVSSCKDEVIATRGEEDADGKITFTVGMSLPAMQSLQTRGILDGFEDNPDGTYLEQLNFYMFVFEDNGAPQANFLRELVYGSDVTMHEAPDGGNYVQFKVRLNGTSEKAILHIVATADKENFEAQLKSVPDRSELGLFAGASGLYTKEHEAYWKRIELNSPIVNDPDTKRKIEEKLSRVRMVRNFLRVTLRTADPDSEEDIEKYGKDEIILNDFVADAFIIANAIDKGYVAAYNENLGDDYQPGFVEFEERDAQGDFAGTMRSYRDLIDKENYVPERHPASERKNPDDNTSSWAGAFEADGGGDMTSKYMFERSIQNDNKTFVILKGHYGTDTTPRYLKLDIGTIYKENFDIDQYPESPYGYFETFQLIRNISYDIVITKVAPNIGHPSVEGALGAPPANNISASIETRPLTRIEDGIDRMQVNQTTYVIVDDDEGNPVPASVDLKWLYEADYYNNGTPSVKSHEVKWNYPGYEFKFEAGADPDGIIQYWGSNQTSTPTHAPYQAADYEDGWRGFNVHFTRPDNVTRQKTIRFYRPNGLSRDVTFIMHKRWEFVNRSPEKYPSNVEVYPGAYSFLSGTMPFETIDELREALQYGDYQDGAGYVGSQRGAQLTVMFELPEDLPEAIFPLDFKIGANRQNIENAYIGNAVATWGKSMFEEEDPVGVSRIQFIKTVTWEDYNKHKVVCARFLTTTDVLNELTSEDEVTENTVSITKVKVENPYFTLGYDEFERKAHQDVIDPTRTRWHWNFTYPEWATYFDTYYDKANDPFNLNNLSFNRNYEKTNANGGLNMRIGTGSQGDPAFEIPVDIASDQFKGTLTIQAWANSRNNGKTHGFHTDYDIYNRDIYAGVYYKVGDTESFSSSGPKDCNATNDYADKTIQSIVFNLNEFNVPANATVTKIVIWSTMDSYSYDERWRIKDGATNYRDILLQLQ